MARFNQMVNVRGMGDTVNLAGGRAHQQSEKLELVSILLTSFVQDQYYRKAEDAMQRVGALVAGMEDKRFAAKAAIYARNEFGMRSISHVVAAHIAKHVKGEEWTKRFFDAVVRRPDDMLEIVALYGTHPLPNAMKKGFALALGRFDSYQLAKYRGEGHAVKLVDLVNLIHPSPTDRNAEALKALVDGSLRSVDTWESKLTQAGQAAETDEDKAELKAEAWRELIVSRKLGYFAALRNTRNVLWQAPDMVGALCELLTNEQAIRKSLVLPFRFLTAIEEIQKLALPGVRQVLIALNRALDISVANVPQMEGKTLVALDVSGSMQGKPSQIGALFAAILYKANDADLLTFDNRARYVSLNPMDSTLTLAQAIPFTGGGTDFHIIFRTANKAYDRVVILSDMQAWIGWNTPAEAVSQYRRQWRADPHIYSFDLAGYGTMQFPERKVYALAGFSEKVFDVMKLLEEDREALIHRIEATEL